MVSKKVYDAYCKKEWSKTKIYERFRNLRCCTFKTEYWDRVKGDDLHPDVVCILIFRCCLGNQCIFMIFVGTAVDGGRRKRSLKKIDAYVDKHGIDIVKTYQSRKDKSIMRI